MALFITASDGNLADNAGAPASDTPGEEPFRSALFAPPVWADATHLIELAMRNFSYAIR
jgi:hypothetical protein